MKRRLAQLGVVVVALCATAAVLATAASAFTLENLPASTTRTQTGKATTATKLTTVGGNEINCSGATETGTETSSKPPEGAFHITFTGCKSEKPIKGVACTGTMAGDTSGQILVLGTWKLVFDTNPTGTLTTALLFEFAEFDIKCTALVDVKVKGSVECLHTNATEKSKIHTFKCESTAGKQKVTKWWDSAGIEHSALLLSSFNSGAFEESGQDGSGEVVSSAEIFADQ